MKAPAIWNPREGGHLTWWRRNVLAPLIVATRPSELRTPEAVDDACRVWILALHEIPEAVIVAGVARLLTGVGPWMPKPGDLRAACAAVVKEQRAAVGPAAAQLIAACPDCHGSTWKETPEGMRRCGCHGAALRLSEGLPEPILLPAAEHEDGAA